MPGLCGLSNQSCERKARRRGDPDFRFMKVSIATCRTGLGHGSRTLWLDEISRVTGGPTAVA